MKQLTPKSTRKFLGENRIFESVDNCPLFTSLLYFVANIASISLTKFVRILNRDHPQRKFQSANKCPATLA